MIILDLNQVFLANIHVSFSKNLSKKIELDEDLVRHMILNSIRSTYMQFKAYGQLIIAADSRNNWRRKVFPYYKAHRKKEREESSFDWEQIYLFMNKVREELKENFPYPVVEVEGAEADDVIATLVKVYSKYENPTLIVSGDKDFIQLHSENVKQFDPIKKRWIVHDDPKRFLAEHILKGDRGDGVPNILSDDNSFVLGKRLKPLSQKKISRWINGIPPAEFTNYLQRNYARNEQLIDLNKLPNDLNEKIIEAYIKQNNKDRSKLMNYFIQHRLRNLMENITDF